MPPSRAGTNDHKLQFPLFPSHNDSYHPMQPSIPKRHIVKDVKSEEWPENQWVHIICVCGRDRGGSRSIGIIQMFAWLMNTKTIFIEASVPLPEILIYEVSFNVSFGKVDVFFFFMWTLSDDGDAATMWRCILPLVILLPHVKVVINYNS